MTRTPTPGPLSADDTALVATINYLRADEGDTVSLLCDNPDFNGQPSNAVECNGGWTDWTDKRFTGDSLFAALNNAALAKAVATKTLAPAAPVEASGSEREADAWKWLGQLYPNDAPSDLAYDANEMVDAFLAGSGRSDRMAKALERIADEQQYRSGYCQTDITVEPALTAEEAQTVAREALAQQTALRPQPSGFLATLTDEQRAEALAHTGDDMHPQPNGETRTPWRVWTADDHPPYDGKWFVAKCDFAVRVVHYEDQHDRLPIDHTGWAWPSVPTHWMRLSDLLALIPPADQAKGGGK